MGENDPQEGSQQADGMPNQIRTTQPNQRTRRALEGSKKNTKAGIKVISLNLNGYGGTGPYHIGNRWAKLNRIMGENKVGITITSETHMTEK